MKLQVVFLASTSAVAIVVIATILALILPNRNLLIVTSEHMMPTLQPGDTVEIDPSAFRSRTPERGEVVYYKLPQYDRPSIGRIVGSPNDEVYFVSKRLVINGQPLQEGPETLHSVQKKNDTLHYSEVPEFIDGYQYEAWYLDSQPLLQTEFSVKLPPDKYFILGDNRSNSADSRLFGPVPRQALLGTVTKIKDSLNKENVGKSLSRRE